MQEPKPEDMVICLGIEEVPFAAASYRYIVFYDGRNPESIPKEERPLGFNDPGKGHGMCALSIDELVDIGLKHPFELCGVTDEAAYKKVTVETRGAKFWGSGYRPAKKKELRYFDDRCIASVKKIA